jgi:Tfp pilus assembly protein PilO
MMNFLQKLLTDYYRWTILGVVLLIAGLGYGLFLNHQITTIQNVSFADRNQAKNQLQQNKSYATALEDSLNKFKKAYSADDIKRLKRALPTSSEFPDILLMLDNLANTAGLRMDNITVTAVAGAVTTEDQAAQTDEISSQASKFSSIPHVAGQDVNVTFTGGTGYEQFKRFLGMFESSQRIFNVISVNFSQAIEGSENVAPYSMIVRTYYLPETATTKE